MNIFTIFILAFGFCSFSFGVTVYLKRPDDIGRNWLLYSLACTFWSIGYSFQINNDINYSTALWCSRISDAIAIFIPLTWIRFVYSYLGLPIRTRFFKWALYLCIGVFFTFPTPYFIPHLKDKSHIGVAHFVDAGPTFHIFTLLFIFLVLLGFWRILQAYLRCREKAKERKQLGLFFIAAILGFGGGSVAFLPVYDIDIPVLWGTLTMPFFPMLTVLAMTRYQFLDVDSIARNAHGEKMLAVGMIAASINHEIRNPLYVIRESIEMCLSELNRQNDGDQKASRKIVEALQRSSAQAMRAMDIMRRFSTFTKRRMSTSIALEKVSVGKVLDDVLLLIRYELEMDRIRLCCHVEDNLPDVFMDRQYLEEILFNLIVNACQAMKENGGCLNVQIHSKSKALFISIKDDGPGMKPEVLAQIFQPFFTTKHEGNGLGLYITQQLVEKIGGTIKCESEWGKGTTFTLAFRQ